MYGIYSVLTCFQQAELQLKMWRKRTNKQNNQINFVDFHRWKMLFFLRCKFDIPAKFVSSEPRSSSNKAINNLIFYNLQRTLCTSKEEKNNEKKMKIVNKWRRNVRFAVIDFFFLAFKTLSTSSIYGKTTQHSNKFPNTD